MNNKTYKAGNRWRNYYLAYNEVTDMGYDDYLDGKGYPLVYDEWDHKRQIIYELGRHVAAIGTERPLESVEADRHVHKVLGKTGMGYFGPKVRSVVDD